jgi:Protein of unknown function (DUF3551)
MRVIFTVALMATALASSGVLAQSAAGEDKAFCRRSGSEEPQCVYDTMQQCQESKRGNTDECIARADAPGSPGMSQ